MSKKYFTNQELIQNYGILFENLKTNAELATELAEYGYTTEEIAQGKALYDKANEKYLANIKEGQEEVTAYKVFSEKLDEAVQGYSTDRKKVRIIYKDQPDVLTNLRLKGRVSKSIASVVDDMKIFYTTLKNDTALAEPLKRLKIEVQHLSEQLQKVSEVEKAYAQYNNEKGENQQATKDKDKAFADLEKWVSEFYSIARIALEDKPQLLESLKKFVRS